MSDIIINWTRIFLLIRIGS